MRKFRVVESAARENLNNIIKEFVNIQVDNEPMSVDFWREFKDKIDLNKALLDIYSILSCEPDFKFQYFMDWMETEMKDYMEFLMKETIDDMKMYREYFSRFK